MAQYPIGFGVLGLGMGRHHAKAIHETEEAELIAVCDRDEERLSPVAELYGCKAYTDFGEMLADPEVQAVSIATESGTHVARGLEAVAAGKHLLVEKPVDVLPERAYELADAVAQAGVKAAGVFQSRTKAINRAIKAAIDEGALGRLIGIHACVPWYRKQSYFQGVHGEWKGTWTLDGGGSLANQGVHTLDLVQWFGGPVDSVFGAFSVYAHEIEAEDHTTALLKFANGALGTIWTTTCAYPGHPILITVFGERGTIRRQDDTLLSWDVLDDEETGAAMMQRYGPQEERGEEDVSSDPMAVGLGGHFFHVRDLCQAIVEDRDPYITIPSATHAVEVFHAVFESGRTGQEVKVRRR